MRSFTIICCTIVTSLLESKGLDGEGSRGGLTTHFVTESVKNQLSLVLQKLDEKLMNK